MDFSLECRFRLGIASSVARNSRSRTVGELLGRFDRDSVCLARLFDVRQQLGGAGKLRIPSNEFFQSCFALFECSILKVLPGCEI
ncbi:MAG TPA: hypothetical protein VGC53_16735 [Vicinamibacteria bacterium]